MTLHFCKNCGAALRGDDCYCPRCGNAAESDGDKAAITLPIGTTTLNINFVPRGSAAQCHADCKISAQGGLPALYEDILKVVRECGLVTVQMLRYMFPAGYIDCCKILEWLEKNKYVERVGGTNIYKSLITDEDVHGAGADNGGG